MNEGASGSISLYFIKKNRHADESVVSSNSSHLKQINQLVLVIPVVAGHLSFLQQLGSSYSLFK